MKKKLFLSIISIAVVIIVAVAVGITVSGQTTEKEKATSAPPTVSPEVNESAIAVDGDEFAEKYIYGMKLKYIKLNDGGKRDELIDKLNAKIDEFYDAVMSGITQSEYDAFESEIQNIVSLINGGSTQNKAPEKTSLTKEKLAECIDNLLLGETVVVQAQIEYHEGNMTQSQKKERLAILSDFYDKCEELMNNVKNGTVSIAEGEKKYNEYSAELREMQSWIILSYRDGPDD